MNQDFNLFISTADNVTRFLQNGLMIFLNIAGFYCCSVLTSQKRPAQKIIIPENQTKRKNYTRFLIYLL